MREYIIYNPTQKTRFLETIDKDQYPELYWERLFEKSKDREERYNKDLCNFTTPQIIEFFKYVDTASIDTLNVMRINLIKYGDWCLENTLIDDNQNHFYEITNEIIGNCVSNIKLKNSIVTREQFNEFLFKLDNYTDRFVFICIFEGITGKNLSDISNIKLADIDKKSKTAKLYSGRIINVSQLFVDIAEEANNQKMYYDTLGRKYMLEPKDTIYRQMIKSQKQNILLTEEKLRIRISRVIKISENYGYHFSVKSLYDSGLIDMINTLSEQNDISAADVLYDSKLFEKIYNKYRLNPDIRRKFLLKYSDFLR